MKTFKDLEDIKLDSNNDEVKGLQFNNGFGINVIKEYNSDGSESGLYECVLLKSNVFKIKNSVNVVVCNCTVEKVTEIMKQIQEL